MSMYHECQTDLKDGKHLLAALTEMGFKCESHEQPQTLYDYQGHARPQKANIIIRRQNTGCGASNDVGFLKTEDGTYQAVISEYDQSVKFNQTWLVALRTGYTAQWQIATQRARGRVFKGREIVQTPQGERIRLDFAAR